MKFSLFRNILLSALSAILYFLAFPDSGCAFFIFIFLIPLLYSLSNTVTYRYSLLTGFMFGTFWVLLMGYWLYPSLVNQYGKSPFEAIIFISVCGILPFGFLFGILGLSFRLFYKKKVFFFIFIVPSLWVAGEYIKEAVPLMVPWGNAGYALLPFENFIQIADICGVYGVSFLIVLINGLIYLLLSDFVLLILNKTKHERTFIYRIPVYLIILFIIFTIPVVYGKARSGKFDNAWFERQGSPLKVRVVQGNFDQKERWSGMGFYYRVKTYLRLSRLERHDENLIVWPETVLNSSIRNNEELLREISGLIGKGKFLITGGIKSENNGKTYYNSAFVISGDKNIFRYDKKLLLPFAETKPLHGILGNYYSAPSEFSTGQGNSVFKTGNLKPGISICLEALYPWYIRMAVNNGANCLVNISNDAWFGNTSMPEIHLMASRLRAIENRRYLIRASNSGISAIISPTGKIEKKTDLFKRTSISGIVFKSYEKSIYSKYGDWIVLAALSCLAITLVSKLFSSD